MINWVVGKHILRGRVRGREGTGSSHTSCILIEHSKTKSFSVYGDNLVGKEQESVHKF